MFDLLGLYEHSIDEKGRLTIPSAYRGDLIKGLVITRGRQPYLNVFPLETWEALIQTFETLPVYTLSRPANLRRLVLAHAVKTLPDSHGRVRIPDHLLQYASIKGQVVLAGVGGHIELWAPDLWEKKLQELESISNEEVQDDMLSI